MDEKAIVGVVTTIAQEYSSFSGLLAGFAFTGLTIYLTRSRGGAPEEGSEVEVRHVASAVFYATISLAISSFLYGNLVGIAPDDPGAAPTALLEYGLILSLSVLSLFNVSS